MFKVFARLFSKSRVSLLQTVWLIIIDLSLTCKNFIIKINEKEHTPMAIFNKKIPNQQPENEPENTPIQNDTPVAADDFDFNRYFLAERRIALENISYETTKPAQSDSGYKLTGRDTVVAQILGNTGVKVTYNRTLKFEPDGPFTLSVSYAVMLIFNPGTRDEVDWKTVDVAAQFRKHCAPICANISSRISLLIAEITSASGNPPMIIGMTPAPQQR